MSIKKFESKSGKVVFYANDSESSDYYKSLSFIKPDNGKTFLQIDVNRDGLVYIRAGLEDSGKYYLEILKNGEYYFKEELSLMEAWKEINKLMKYHVDDSAGGADRKGKDNYSLDSAISLIDFSESRTRKANDSAVSTEKLADKIMKSRNPHYKG